MNLTAEILQILYRYACTLTLDQTHAYDLVHDAVEKYLHIDKREKKKQTRIEKPEHYLCRMIRNHYIDQLRHAKKYPLEDICNTDHAIEQNDMSQLENSVIAEQALEKIWPELSALERELLHLWAVENFTAQEIADFTDTPRGTILSRIHRLRLKIDRTVNKIPVEQQGGNA